MVTPSSIRERILKERGVSITHPATGKHAKVRKSAPRSEIPNHLKTSKMLYLELKYHKPIEALLLAGSLSVVARKLNNEVDTSTISKWIKRLRLKWTLTNLPECSTCQHWQSTQCTEGVCAVLMDAGLYELAMVKTKQVREVTNG